MLGHVVSLLDGLDRERYLPVLMAGRDEPVSLAARKLGIRVIPAAFGQSLDPVAEIGHALRIKAAIHEVGASLVHVHGFRVSVPGRMAARLARIPAVYTVHNSLLTAAARGGVKRKLYTAVERRLISSTSLYIAVSRAIERELADKLGVSTDKIATIPNGIDSKPFLEAAAKRKAVASGAYDTDSRVDTVSGITVCRLIPSKGVADLLEALALLTARGLKVKWQVVGDGPEREELAKKARTLGIADRVTFSGYRPAEELPGLLAAADIFALPSKSEASGLAVLEAMAVGIPVIAARSGGVPELVADGQTGFLVEPGKPDELARAIERVLREPALGVALGENGRQRVQAEFTVEKMVARTQEAYDAVLGRE